MGDTFSNISASTIINRSLIQGSVDRARTEAGEDSAEALRKVIEAVASSGNPTAAAFMDQFNEELSKPVPRKSLLKASWDNLVTALPTVTAIAGAVGAIAKIFS